MTCNNKCNKFLASKDFRFYGENHFVLRHNQTMIIVILKHMMTDKMISTNIGNWRSLLIVFIKQQQSWWWSCGCCLKRDRIWLVISVHIFIATVFIGCILSETLICLFIGFLLEEKETVKSIYCFFYSFSSLLFIISTNICSIAVAAF